MQQQQIFERVSCTEVKYIGKSGELIFEEGDNEKFIEIELLDDDHWDPTLEFKVARHAGGSEGKLSGVFCRVVFWAWK